MNTEIKRADWVTTKAAPGMVGTVKRIAHDGSWADVNWHTHTKRMSTSVLTVQTTIQVGDYNVTDENRRQELGQDEPRCVNCYGWSPTACTNCHQPLCGECNDALNEEQGEDADGMCWECRERANGTYIGA